MVRLWWLGEKPVFCAKIFPYSCSYGVDTRSILVFECLLMGEGYRHWTIFKPSVTFKFSIYFMFLHPLPHFPDPIGRMKGTAARAHLSMQMPLEVTDPLKGQAGLSPVVRATCISWHLVLRSLSSKCQVKQTIYYSLGTNCRVGQ